MVPELLMQTLHMPVEDIGPCTEKSEDGEENYIQTKFDEMVTDFCNEIADQGYIIVGNNFAVAGNTLLAIIQYMKKEGLRAPGGKVIPVEGILQDM